MPTLVKVTLKGRSGSPKDQYVNNYVFSADPDPGPRTAMSNAIDSFLNGEPPGAEDALQSYLSWNIVRGAGAVAYDYYFLGVAQLDGSPLGSPVHSDNRDLLAWPETQSLPSQVACVLSLAADMTGDPEVVPNPPEGPAGDDRPRTRKRGRLFLGPLSVRACANADGIGSPRVSPGLIATLLDRCAFLTAPVGAEQGRLCVWSRENQAVQPVVSMTVDNSLDTQRRRKVISSARTPVYTE